MASDEEFVAGTSETASPSVKQVKDEFATPANINAAISGLASETYVNQQISQSNPIGTIITWSTSTPPYGHLICDGSAISRTTYSKLFGVIGTTYGEGDGSTTFNLPNANAATLWQRTDHKVNQKMDGALPNITGVLNIAKQEYRTGTSGAFSLTGAAGNLKYAADGAARTGNWGQATLNASNSSSVYTDGETRVIPSNIAVVFCIKYL